MAAVIGASGGTLTINSVAYRVVQMTGTLTQETVDTSVLGSFVRSFTAGPRTGTISATVETDSATATAALTVLKGSTAGTAYACVLDPAGADSLNFNAFITSAAVTTTYADREVVELELQITGAVS
jgi:hypothetical protein